MLKPEKVKKQFEVHSLKNMSKVIYSKLTIYVFNKKYKFILKIYEVHDMRQYEVKLLYFRKFLAYFH
jgi:hypothetical protein